MLRRLIQLSSSTHHLQFIRGISSTSNLRTQCSTSRQNEDISEEVVASRQMVLAREMNSKSINKLLSHVSVKHIFKQFLHCTDDEVNMMIRENKRLIDAEPTKISDMIQFLFENDVSISSIVDNPWLLSMEQDYLCKKLIRLKLLKPKRINDFVPLLKVSYQTLNRLMRIMNRERNFVPEGNRIYYLSTRLAVDPALVSKYIATHTFMFEINFEMFVENLDVLLEYEIEPINILRDMWAFKYYPKSIRDRLERCKLGGKDNLRPWMVRCPEEVLENSLKITQENKNCLGDLNLIEYISQRLGYDIDTVTSMVERHPNVLKTRGTKAEKVLDYLLNEEKFEPIEVLRVLRILVHSLETTRKRLNELKAIGCRPSTLTIVCRSQNEYKKFVRAWLDRSESRY